MAAVIHCGLCGAPTPQLWGVPTYNGDLVSNAFEAPGDLGGVKDVCRMCFIQYEKGHLKTHDRRYMRPGPLGVGLVNGAGI